MNILQLCLATGILLLLPSNAIAQITPDGSTATTVDNNGNTAIIDGGNGAGTNLFHSFDSFSVPNGNEAFFNNGVNVENIFSRVTGGNISTIDGLIRANNANLFLINPAGVIFGNGARLDLGGEFYGGTADSILFEDGEFSATNLDAPVLTINAPIGLNFRDRPGSVVVESNNLTTTRQNITLFGDNIRFENGTLNALGNNVNLAAVSGGGIVNFKENLDLDFSNVSLGDITVNNSRINVTGEGGGEIEVNARNLSLSNNSIFSAGIGSENSTIATQAGDITLNVTETITLESESIIRNNLSPVSSGNAGNILINAQNLSLADNSRLSSFSTGNGNTGNITLNIVENTSLRGTAEIKSEVSSGGMGNAGDIEINSNSISLRENSKLLADVRGSGNGGDIFVTTNTLELSGNSSFSTNLTGNGSAGNINIEAEDSILLGRGAFQTTVLEDAIGNAGNIDIDTGSITLNTDTSRIRASTSGIGDAGSININADNVVSLSNNSSIQTQVEFEGEGKAGDIIIDTTDLFITDGTDDLSTSLLANSEGIGDGGNITINASGNINLNGFGLILSQGTAGTGDAGDVIINSDTLSLDTRSIIISSTGDAENLDVSNEGDAGDIIINSRITTLDGFSGISSSSISNATGNAGNVTVNSDRLTIADSGINALTENNSAGGIIEVNASNLDLITGGKIITLTNGVGDAGDIVLNINEQITIDGANPPIPPEEFRSPLEVLRALETETGLFANTTDISTGNGGNITINNSPVVSIFNDGQITVDSEGAGNGGNITINAESLNLNSRSRLIAQTQQGNPEAEPSNINLQIDNSLSLRGDSQISARAFNNANGGNVNINAEFVIAFTPETEGNDIIASANEGSGGQINITAQEIFGLQENRSELGNGSNDLDVSSEFGFNGDLSLNTPDISSKTGIRDLPTQAINPGENVQQACSPHNNIGTSSLSIKGRGGIPAPPSTILSSDDILFKGEFYEVSSTNSDRHNTAKSPNQPNQPNQQSPIMTAQGEIYPARGVLVTDAGEVILTRFSNSDIRNSELSNTNSKCLIN